MAALRKQVATLEEALALQTARTRAAEEEAKVFTQLKAQKLEDQAIIERLRGHVVEVSRESTKRQHELQTALQSARTQLEEVRLEYHSHSERSVAEVAALERARKAEVGVIREQLEALRARAESEISTLHAEHQEIVHALYDQFTEYRGTAERLFYSEAKHFQERVAAQTKRFEAELGHVVRTKDFLFSTMVAGKDAKIMALIDGTDFQKVTRGALPELGFDVTLTFRVRCLTPAYFCSHDASHSGSHQAPGRA